MPYDMFFSSFHTNWWCLKEANKKSFDVFCDLLIRVRQKFLDKGKFDGKQWYHSLKGKGNQNYRNRESANVYGPWQDYHTQKSKLKSGESSKYQKYWKKNIFHCFGNCGHVGKTCWKKSVDLEEKAKRTEGDVETVCLTSWSTNDFTFNVGTSQALLAQTSQNEWVVDSCYTYHMSKYGYLFYSYDNTIEKNIVVANNFALNIVDHGDINYWHGKIVDVFHVPSLSANFLLVSQLTYTIKIVEFWPNQFLINNPKDELIFEDGTLDPKDWLYKLCYLPWPESQLMTLIA